MSGSPPKYKYAIEGSCFHNGRHGNRSTKRPPTNEGEQHFHMKSPTGETIKIKTPEKIKIKKASVVLEKLDEGEILGINTRRNKAANEKKSPVYHTQTDKSFPYNVEYRIEDCLGRSQHNKQETISSITKTKTKLNEIKTCSSQDKSPTSGYMYKPKFRQSRSEKFVNPTLSETFKSTPSINTSQMKIKHGDNVRIRSYVSRRKLKGGVTEHSQSSMKKSQEADRTDIVTSPRLSSFVKTESLVLPKPSNISPQKEKPTFLPANLSLIKFSSDVKDLTEEDGKRALQRLAVVGSTTKSAEENKFSPLKEARAQFTAKLNSMKSQAVEMPPLNNDVMQVKQYMVTPFCASHIKSDDSLSNDNHQSGTNKVIEEKSDKVLPQFPFEDGIKEGKRTRTIVPQRSIPGKRTSILLKVDGRKNDGDEHMLDPKDAKSPAKSCEKTLTRRYKNTRYTIPFRSPSIVVPKNYDAFANTPKSQFEAKGPATRMPELSDGTVDLMRKRYKRTGRITTVPILPKTTESLVQVSPGIHTMKDTKDLLNVTSIHTVEKPACETFETPRVSSRHLSPGRVLATSPTKLPGSNDGMTTSVEARSSFYSAYSSKRYCELVTENDQLNNMLSFPDYVSLINYQQSPLKNVHQKYSKNKTDASRLPRSHRDTVPCVTQESMPNNNANECVDVSMPSVCPVPSTSSYTQSHTLPERDCSGCFYCEFEEMMKKIDSDGEHIEEITQIYKSDHAYTRTDSSTVVISYTSNIIQETTPSEVTEVSDETPDTSQQKIEGQMPVNAFQLGDNIILMPCANPGPQIPTKSEPKLQTKEKTNDVRNQQVQGRTDKKKHHRKTRTPKRNNFRNVCRDQLRFTRSLRLLPLKKKTKTSANNPVADVLRELGKGRHMKSKVYVPVLQIERDFDDVFTHISAVASTTVMDGSDAVLKRWNDFDDYPVRFSTDTISGAITEMEVDALPQGFYKFMKTGHDSMRDSACKSMAILSSVPPNVSTIMGDSIFLAVGPTSNNSKSNTEQPATIQKHKNMSYLLKSIENLIGKSGIESVVSDQTYRPKCHSPSWYQTPRFDAFTRLYHRQRKVSTTADKLTESLFTRL